MQNIIIQQFNPLVSSDKIRQTYYNCLITNANNIKK